MKCFFTLFAAFLFGQQVLAQVPTIQSFSPISGPVGTIVIVTGTNFNPTAINNVVRFGAVKSTVISATPTSLTVIVPAGATYQPITVTTNGLTASAHIPFIITFTGSGTSFYPSSFKPATNYTAGNGPSCVAAGDLDIDGKPELFAVSENDNILSIFRNTSVNGTVDFSTKSDFSTGNKPYYVVAGDLEGDGKLDLVVVNGLSNNLSIYRNTSSGPGIISFAPRVDLQTGSFPFCVAIMDLDGDGRPDLAAANSTGSSISIFRNNSVPGIMSFSPKSDFQTGSSPFWVSAGDLDNDGKPDLVTANAVPGNSGSVLRNTSSPGIISFATKLDINGGGNSFNVMMGDINGDGKLDLAMANGTDPSLAILINNSASAGNISFSPTSTYYTGIGSFCAALSDMDGDGKPDVIVANGSDSTVSVLKNNSVGGFLSFDQKRDFAVGNMPWIITAVDLDGDSKPDIATANHGSQNISVVQNKVSALAIQSFSPKTAGSGTTVTISGANFVGITGVQFGGVAATSFDILSANTISAVVGTGVSGNVTVTTNTATATLAGFIYVPAPRINSFSPVTAGTGDTITINGTGFANGMSQVSFGGVPATSFTVISSTKVTAVVGAGASGSVAVNTAGGVDSLTGFIYVPPPIITSFTPKNAAPGSVVTITGNNFSGTTKVMIGEIDARSYSIISPTIILAVVDSFSGGAIKVTTAFGTGKLGGFYNGLSITSFAPTNGLIGSNVTITGTNFDPVPANNIVYFGAVRALVISGNTSSLVVVVPAGSTYQPISVTTNHLAAFSDKPFVQTFLNADSLITASSFDTKLDFSTGDNVEKSAVGDLNGDGKPDLVVPNAGIVSVFNNTSNNGVISFDKIDLPVPGNLSVSLSDLDADGKLDIIAISNSPSIWVARNVGNNGTMSFSAPVNLLTGGGSIYRLAVNDIDGDGKPDLITTEVLNSKVSIFRNTSANGQISFELPISYPAGYDPQSAFVSDLDGDKKPDLVVSNLNYNKLLVYRNTSKSGQIMFEYPLDVIAPSGLGSVSISDFDGDNKPDVAVTNTVDTSIIIFRNVSTYGNISFEPPKRVFVGINLYDLAIHDLDGDGKTDIAAVSIISETIYVLKNASVTGNISFTTPAEYGTGRDPVSVLAADFDVDGKPDLAVANFHSFSFSIYRNKMGETNAVNVCPPLANTSITSKITGANYQWQVNTGSNFITISNSSNYSGTNTATLQLSNIPSSWNRYKYRCLVDGKYSEVFELKFSDSWTGAVSSAWENSANWTCAKVPDSNTDVMINTGTAVINTNVTIRSLKVSPGAAITINAGFNLTVLH